MHAHLLPMLDDGARSWEESLQLANAFHAWGYEKLIVTPHIHPDFYPNTPVDIHTRLAEWAQLLHDHAIPLRVEAAAEYFLNEQISESLEQNVPLLTFGKRYLLFEISHLQEPLSLKDFIFKASTLGYQLVLAHPERYEFLSAEKLDDLRHRGVLLQVNTMSLAGYYGKFAQKRAEYLIDRGYVSWLGTDCHHVEHLPVIQKARASKHYRKALSLPLLNHSLL
ncbi:MAG: capsular biosynthesis protein [Cyclobacteriaceae bacterium]|nr:capsular biosynthesis protein [Cyclobacteriaceae bacterium]